MEKIVKLDFSTNLNSITSKLRTDKELLLCFELKEKDLNKKTGEKIATFLNSLKSKNIRFSISRPIPRCLFSATHAKMIEQFNIPKNCYECKELFKVENDTIKSCDPVNKKGPKIYYLKEKNQIWELFNTLRLEKKPAETCKRCLYFKRRTCDGLCFRL